jgi:NADPH-dependent 2,4-dienoyl-CoA reductase/sulfur reductase-like enzyme
VVLFPLLVRGVRWYRGRLLERLAKLPLVKFLLGTRIVGWYRKLDELGLL